MDSAALFCITFVTSVMGAVTALGLVAVYAAWIQRQRSQRGRTYLADLVYVGGVTA